MNTEEKNGKEWTRRKSENRQMYYNIATGLTIGFLVFLLSAAFGWVAKMQITVNKADMALREIAQNNKKIEKNTTVLHRRINDNGREIKEINALAIRADERAKRLWELYLR